MPDRPGAVRAIWVLIAIVWAIFIVHALVQTFHADPRRLAADAGLGFTPAARGPAVAPSPSSPPWLAREPQARRQRINRRRERRLTSTPALIATESRTPIRPQHRPAPPVRRYPQPEFFVLLIRSVRSKN